MAFRSTKGMRHSTHTCKHVKKPCVKSQKAGTHLGIVCIAASLLNSRYSASRQKQYYTGNHPKMRTM